MISILGNQLVTESYYGSDIEEVTLENPQKYERDNGMYIAIQESYSDIVGIYEAIAITDMKELQQRASTGTLMESTIVMEGFKERVKAIWEKIKAWLTKLWNKIKTFFKNLYTVISSLFMSGKQFVEKNKKALTSVGSKKVTLKNTFKYELKKLESVDQLNSSDDYTAEYEKLIDRAKAVINTDGTIKDQAKLDELKAELKAMKDGKDDDIAEYRGAMVGKANKKLTAEEYQDELDVYFQNGDRVAGDVTYTVNEAMTLLLANHKKAVDTAQTAFDKLFKKVNAVNDKFKNTAEKLDNSTVSAVVVDTINAFVSVQNGLSSAMATFLSKWRKAVNTANSDAKRVCVRAMIGKVDQ